LDCADTCGAAASIAAMAAAHASIENLEDILP
jgi:hypothetical protein